jgi:hypothetical protein
VRAKIIGATGTLSHRVFVSFSPNNLMRLLFALKRPLAARRPAPSAVWRSGLFASRKLYGHALSLSLSSSSCSSSSSFVAGAHYHSRWFAKDSSKAAVDAWTLRLSATAAQSSANDGQRAGGVHSQRRAERVGSENDGGTDGQTGDRELKAAAKPKGGANASLPALDFFDPRDVAQPTFKYQCGDLVETKISKIRGVIIQCIDQETGCSSYAVTPEGCTEQLEEHPGLEILEPLLTLVRASQLEAPLTAPFLFPFGLRARDRRFGVEGVVVARKRTFGANRYVLLEDLDEDPDRWKKKSRAFHGCDEHAMIPVGVDPLPPRPPELAAAATLAGSISMPEGSRSTLAAF